MWAKIVLFEMIRNQKPQHLLLRMRGLFLVLLVTTSHGAGLPPEIFSKLKSEEFKVREEGQAQMLQWATLHRQIAIDELYRQSQIGADPEQRERCLNVLRELIVKEFEEQGEGFVGIQMQDVMAAIKEDGKPVNVNALRITHVIPGMAAEAAGLKVNDTIVGLNGKKWANEVVSVAFMESIKKLKPGTKVKLEILRMDQMQVVEVTLCRRPQVADPRFGLNMEQFEAQRQAEKEAYFRKWMEQRKPSND